MQLEPAVTGPKGYYLQRGGVLSPTEVSAGNIIRMIRTSWPTVGAPCRLCGLSNPPPFTKYRAKYDLDADHNKIICYAVATVYIV